MTNAAGIELIKHFEGLKLKAYQDSVGVWTIGYGHTGGVKSGQRITPMLAEALLREDIAWAERCVLELVRVPLNANQFSALVSFVFNLGVGRLKQSTLLRKLNSGAYEAAAVEFDRWVYAGTKKLAGLVKRRRAEKALFLK